MGSFCFAGAQTAGQKGNTRDLTHHKQRTSWRGIRATELQQISREGKKNKTNDYGRGK